MSPRSTPGRRRRQGLGSITAPDFLLLPLLLSLQRLILRRFSPVQAKRLKSKQPVPHRGPIYSGAKEPLGVLGDLGWRDGLVGRFFPQELSTHIGPSCQPYLFLPVVSVGEFSSYFGSYGVGDGGPCGSFRISRLVSWQLRSHLEARQGCHIPVRTPGLNRNLLERDKEESHGDSSVVRGWADPRCSPCLHISFCALPYGLRHF